MVRGTQNFRQVRAMRCVIPYGLLVVCIALDEVLFWRDPCLPLYSLGDRVTWKSQSNTNEGVLSDAYRVVSFYSTSPTSVRIVTMYG